MANTERNTPKIMNWLKVFINSSGVEQGDDELEEEMGELFSEIVLPPKVTQTIGKSPSVWAFERHGAFWERDVPRNSDEFFKENFRVDRSSFNILVERLKGLEKMDTVMRKAIPLDKIVHLRQTRV